MVGAETKNNNEKPLVSVIMPAYNACATLEAAAESVLGQTHCELELIIIDDGSKDGTASTGKALAGKDSRVRFVSTPNAGPAAARNTGLDMARGKYATFVDSDDFIEPDMLSEMVNAAEQTGADVSVCGASIEYPKGGGANRRICFGEEGLFTGDKLKKLFDMPQMTIFFSGWGKLYKRSIIEAGSMRMDTAYRITEDSDFAMRYLQNCSSVYLVDRCFYRYMQVNSASLTQIKDPEALKASGFNIADRLKALMLKWGVEPAEAQQRSEEYLYDQLKAAAFIKLRSGAKHADKKAFCKDVLETQGLKDYLKNGALSSRVLASGVAPALVYTKLHGAYLRLRGKK